MTQMEWRCFLPALFFCDAFALSATPRLRVKPKFVSLGSLSANEEQIRDFIVYNNGDDFLQSNKIRSTCGCAGSEVTVDENSPGIKTTVPAKIVPESITGLFSKSFFIPSNDLTKPIASVMGSGVSIPLVTVLSQNFIYPGTLFAGEKFEQEFLLEVSESVEWGKYQLIDSPENVVIEIDPVHREDNTFPRQFRLVVSWTPTEKISPFKITIKLPVIKPEHWNPVELLIQGTVENEEQE